MDSYSSTLSESAKTVLLTIRTELSLAEDFVDDKYLSFILETQDYNSTEQGLKEIFDDLFNLLTIKKGFEMSRSDMLNSGLENYTNYTGLVVSNESIQRIINALIIYFASVE
ncbi:MAG: hypothetical protein ACRCXZ_09775 [Patescibacteria group bacterium]